VDISRGFGATNKLTEEMVVKGSLGAKSGRGFYDYSGRTEAEILKARDIKYLKMIECLEKIEAFKPI